MYNLTASKGFNFGRMCSKTKHSLIHFIAFKVICLLLQVQYSSRLDRLGCLLELLQRQ